MKLKLIIICLLATVNSYAQKIIDKVDPFTHQHIKQAVVVFGKSIAPVPITLSIFEKNDKKYLAFVWNSTNTLYGNFYNVDMSKVTLMFKFKTDSILTFRPDPVAASDLNAGFQGIFYVVSEISDAELNYFMLNDISNFRVAMQLDGTGVDLDNNYLFTDRNKNQFKKAAMYMLGMQEVEDKVQ